LYLNVRYNLAHGRSFPRSGEPLVVTSFHARIDTMKELIMREQ
jgi:hypothetical protein